MRLIFARHAETEENAAGIIQGHLPGRLSKTGKNQASLLAQRLKGERIDHIYSSDLARAVDTAHEIAKHHPGTPIEFVRELRERDYGRFQGKRKSEIEYGAWKRELYSLRAHGQDVETLEEVRDRLAGFLQRTMQKHRNETVLFVGHGGMGRILTTIILHRPLGEVRQMPRIENASISIFELSEDNRHRLHLLNDVEHLGPESMRGRSHPREDF